MDKPETFNEKLQWLKLNDRDPRYTAMVDKVTAKNYAAKRLGKEYIVPTLGVYKSFDEIDFDSLPDRFVLKCNHDSGSVVICGVKDGFDREKARKTLTKGLKTDAFYWGREYPYRHVKRRILAEEYLEDGQQEIRDYKLMCFNGKVKCSFVCSDRFSAEGLCVTFYDRDWNVMPFERHYPRAKVPAERPLNYDKMVEFAERLSKGIAFLRVDFYEVGGRLYFGEMTFYPGSGWEEFTPEKWDVILGSWLDIGK